MVVVVVVVVGGGGGGGELRASKGHCNEELKIDFLPGPTRRLLSTST